MTKVIGLMSGTSIDGIDAALVEITGSQAALKIELLQANTYPYPETLRQRILDLCSGSVISLAELASLDDDIAQEFAKAAIQINTGHPKPELIGSHGQTVYHRPPEKEQLGYSLQLGRGSQIATLTKITTISNFRSADINAGGQGAPLVPRVDAYLLSHPTKSRCVQNLGGIGNTTYLPAQTKDNQTWETKILGWDTGPGNVLIDLAVQHFSNSKQTYDKNGQWASTGKPCQELIQKWMQHSFFHQPPPKSTGRELFSPQYFQQCLEQAKTYHLTPADILATLSELTAISIAHSYQTFLPQMPEQVLLCGGGSRNLYLKSRLEYHLKVVPVLTTDEVGLNADFKEAIAFAVLAYWRNQGIVGNLPQVTGAKKSVLLGEIHFGSE
ncbi:anhydro-N-acetylmuramic acid kinase [Ancylothrix sp. C2]|uniref:anhydro-N-acetylmuramic acid kinase n=1 Tax=Ancylothrix sp. D3o TaxID=2953691 RepID=UPI0021BB52F7|nr:anhydro-N-acetylmuramic acid kinase [Ancylothrix sp. D3o]MCT7950502.1 anhydro-N-acetylmuramic acid kinase [Ancylothrix sp. D3o]